MVQHIHSFFAASSISFCCILRSSRFRTLSSFSFSSWRLSVVNFSRLSSAEILGSCLFFPATDIIFITSSGSLLPRSPFVTSTFRNSEMQFFQHPSHGKVCYGKRSTSELAIHTGMYMMLNCHMQSTIHSINKPRTNFLSIDTLGLNSIITIPVSCHHPIWQDAKNHGWMM